ncbi:MAG: glycine cleavage system protein GcvH [Trueperaceae bacterium]|jgi:glycine cleavage system H protein|nr:glycine cleavage system protein GcvH [Truepera sp.]HRN18601.1 glycine cleavage system protein GcvH [Trueperaceae bacterium]HRQ10024.1 glycine cleavage system protein GcvH [Trueperaceae bacterium]
MNTPEELRYAPTHEYARREDETVTVGITDFAQDQLGDVVFVELPESGRRVSKGEQVAVVESVKTASDIYSPVSGVITDVNGALENTPELINDQPYTGGWLFRVEMENDAELNELLDADAYQKSALEEG